MLLNLCMNLYKFDGAYAIIDIQAKELKRRAILEILDCLNSCLTIEALEFALSCVIPKNLFRPLPMSKLEQKGM